MAINKKLTTNALLMSAVQILMYVTPLMLLPFLSRILPTTDFGIYAVGFSLFAFLSVVADFGFTILGPYLLATKPKHARVQSKIFSNVTTAKIILGIFLSLVAPLMAATQEVWRTQFLFFVFIGASVLINAALPLWFFQGVEKVLSITIATFVSRLLFITTVLLIVRGPELLWAVSLAHLSSLACAACVYVVFLRRLNIKFSNTSPFTLKHIFKKAFPFFVSRASVTLYTSLLPILIGISSGLSQAAFFSIADQFYRGAQSLANPVVQVIFPHVSRQRDTKSPIRLAALMGMIAIVGLLIVAVTGRELINLVTGNGYEETYVVLVLLFGALIFSAPGQMLGLPAFGALGQLRYVNFSVYWGAGVAALTMIIMLVAGELTAAKGAICVILAESVVFVLRAYWFNQKFKELSGAI